ncbi:MAG TPA: hypothetical protein VK929_10370 [Longimicrobiales bacterium]|nr:hypothetical protein [Longimicrobiales bacterium]
MKIVPAGDGPLIPARIGALRLHATPAELRATRRTSAERLTRTVLTVAGCWVVAPLAALIPPHFEAFILALLLGLYFGRRAWVGEWQVISMDGTCPRCDGTVSIRAGTMLYLPHTLHCGSCRTELWLELEPAPDVSPEVRAAAREQLLTPAPEPPGQRQLGTWSPASSSWRDRPRSDS